MQSSDIGQQLRAFRLESGLRADEIAARLGVSRAALYRYEKGDVIKLDTVKRLAELLKISPLSLLGVGVEYYSRPIAYFERARQIEETVDQILYVNEAFSYLTTSVAFDQVLIDSALEHAEAAGMDRAAAIAAAEQVHGILAARKRAYASRRPGIICIISGARVRELLEDGIAGALAVSDGTRKRCREIANAEIAQVADMMEAEPMGLQFGLVPGNDPGGAFQVMRGRDRATVAVNPFRADVSPTATGGVAMITGADEAVSAHQRAAEAQWRGAHKGAAAATRIRNMLGSNR